ncbi:unnamed protein product [Diamesa hyperborea]
MVESYFNTINHVLNGSVALYMTWLCFQAGWTITTWHALLLTIGYQLLMAEGIMALYSANSWSYFHSKSTKRLVHLIVLVGATILILVGNSIKIANTSSVKHFKSIHAITGLVSMVFLVLGVLQGFTAFYAKELKVYIKPVYNKFLHILMATVCFVTGMVSLIYGYKKNTVKRNSTDDIRLGLTIFAIITTILSLVGAIKTVFQQVKIVLRK